MDIFQEEYEKNYKAQY
jgi:isocitrate dehydrogenase